MRKKFLRFGIFRRNGKIVNHRSILNVFINPFLRTLFGGCIATEYFPESDSLGNLKWLYVNDRKFEFFSDYNDYDEHLSERVIL